MTPTSCTVLVWVAVLAYCAAHSAPENACFLGGPLEVYSTPTHLPTTAAQCDIVYRKEDWQQTPTIRYLAAEPSETYTLFTIDPDAPDHPPGIYFVQYILANIPGKDFQYGDFNRASILCSYQGPTPPEGSGLHRYMFYVYRHAASTSRLSLTVDQPGSPGREFFDLKAYLKSAERQGVHLIGPLAGVQFRSAFEFPLGEWNFP